MGYYFLLKLSQIYNLLRYLLLFSLSSSCGCWGSCFSVALRFNKLQHIKGSAWETKTKRGRGRTKAALTLDCVCVCVCVFDGGKYQNVRLLKCTQGLNIIICYAVVLFPITCLEWCNNPAPPPPLPHKARCNLC